MGCDEISKLSIRLRNVVLATLTVLQIFNNIMLFRSSALKSFWKRDIVQIEMEKIQRHNEVLFCIQFGASSIWSWIWRINVIQRRLCYIILVSIYHWHRTSNILFITHERNSSWEKKDKPDECASLLVCFLQGIKICFFQGIRICIFQGIKICLFQGIRIFIFQGIKICLFQGIRICIFQGIKICLFQVIKICIFQGIKIYGLVTPRKNNS